MVKGGAGTSKSSASFRAGELRASVVSGVLRVLIGAVQRDHPLFLSNQGNEEARAGGHFTNAVLDVFGMV